MYNFPQQFAYFNSHLGEDLSVLVCIKIVLEEDKEE
jgi:hypothetical protein